MSDNLSVVDLHELILGRKNGSISFSPTDLIVVNPPDTIVLGDVPHALGEGLAVGHDEVVVDDGDDVALGGEGATHLLVDPVLLVLVTDAPVQRAGCAHQQEVLGLSDVLEQTLVEFSRFQARHIEED